MRILGGLLLSASLAAPHLAFGQTTSRVNVSSAGFEANGDTGGIDMTPDGRYVTFYSDATNLTAEGNAGIIWRDRATGSTVFVAPGTTSPTISDDGQFVAFGRPSSVILPSDQNHQNVDLFLWSAADRSVQPVASNVWRLALISGNGRYVAYIGSGTGVVLYDRVQRRTISVSGGSIPAPARPTADGSFVIVTRPLFDGPGDTNGSADVYKINVQNNQASLVSTNADGSQGTCDSEVEDISADGRFVLFDSCSPNFPGSRPRSPITWDLFVKDTQAGTLTQVNVNRSGQRLDFKVGFGYAAGNGEPAISADGRWVTFTSSATNVVAGDTNGFADAFLYDRLSGDIVRVDTPSTGGQAGGGASRSGVASADGRYVLFSSSAHNMVPGDTNFAGDVFVRDLQGSAPCEVSLSPNGLQVVSAAGGAGTVSVVAAASCAWEVALSASWIHLSSASSGSGNGTISYSFDPFTSSSGIRSGSIVANTAALGLRQLVTTVAPFAGWDEPSPSTLAGAGWSGAVPFTGWAVDDVRVARIRLYREPVAGEGAVRMFVGDALQVAGARPDVAALFPQYPYNTLAGWGLMVLTNMLPNQGNGSFRFYVYVDDADGHTLVVGPRTVLCDNAMATRPFGTIDTPEQGGTVSGTIVNFGWALTPLPGMIPANGATIDVFIDGINVGHPTYNQPRSDIAALFPGYRNSGGPVGYFTFDTRAYADGLHTIAWTVADGLGASGIGSRYFTIQNGNSPATTPFLRAEAAASTSRSRQPIVRVRGDAREWIEPDPDGAYEVRVKNLHRLELHLDPWHGTASCDRFAAAALPAGASLDPLSGVLVWQPAPGVGGAHDIHVVRTTCGGGAETIPVRVVFELR